MSASVCGRASGVAGFVSALWYVAPLSVIVATRRVTQGLLLRR